MLGFLHTAEAHRATFEGLLNEMHPGLRHIHLVHAELLQAARQSGQTAELAAAISADLATLRAEGTTAVLCTCSTIGGIAETVGRDIGLPTIRGDRPMAEHAVALGERILVVMTVASTLEPTCNLLQSCALSGKRLDLRPLLIEGAVDLFLEGAHERYEKLVCETVRRELGDAEVVVLAQPSMASAAVSLADLGVPVLTSPSSGLAAALDLLDRTGQDQIAR